MASISTFYNAQFQAKLCGEYKNTVPISNGFKTWIHICTKTLPHWLVSEAASLL